MSAPRRLAILGSTGSIGTQALDVVRAMPHELQVVGLSTNGNARLLVQQALEFRPVAVCVTQPDAWHEVQAALSPHGIEVLQGPEGLLQLAVLPGAQMVLTALVGFAGLAPTLAAIGAGKHIALANKETLVVAGQLVMQAARQAGVQVLPVDSEHNALFQCLQGEDPASIERLILTASGGPFRGYSWAQLQQVTPQQALKHPNWTMGAKITIDSATMFNKGLEVMEARWLFDVPANTIQVVVHPGSVVHSLVQFCDGSLKAELGPPDMRRPIQYALCWPHRRPSSFRRLDFSQPLALEFHPPDVDVFRSIPLAYEALNQGGNRPCVLNAANEVAVERFLNGSLSFPGIFAAVEHALQQVPHVDEPCLDDLLATDAETRTLTRSLAFA